MSNCPYCGSELKIPEVVFRNVETYGNSAVTNSSCCKKGLRVYPKVSYVIVPALGPDRQDDWGDDIKASSREDLKFWDN